MRHQWENDVCVRCGLSRHGYGGGRTGLLEYRYADGSFAGNRAGSCRADELERAQKGGVR